MIEPKSLGLPGLTIVLLFTAPAAFAQAVRFDDIDTNNDGVLDAAELLAVFDVAGLSLMSRDRNGDAAVSQAELRGDNPDEDVRPERRDSRFAAASNTNRAYDRSDVGSDEDSSSSDLGDGGTAATSIAAGDTTGVGSVGSDDDAGQDNGDTPQGDDEGAPGKDPGDQGSDTGEGSTSFNGDTGNTDAGLGSGDAPQEVSEGTLGDDPGYQGSVGSDTGDGSTSSNNDGSNTDADQGQGSVEDDDSQGSPSSDGGDQGDAGTGSTGAASSSDDGLGTDGSPSDDAADQGQSSGVNSAKEENPS